MKKAKTKNLNKIKLFTSPEAMKSVRQVRKHLWWEGFVERVNLEPEIK